MGLSLNIYITRFSIANIFWIYPFEIAVIFQLNLNEEMYMNYVVFGILDILILLAIDYYYSSYVEKHMYQVEV